MAPNCSLCGTKATLSFSAYPVFTSFSAEPCAILQALRWFRQHQQVCHFSSSPALSLPLCPLLRLCFYFKLSGRSVRNRLLFPPVISGYTGSTGTHFSQGTRRLMSYPDGERYSRPLQSLVVSLLVPLVSTLQSFLGLEAYFRI